MSPMRDAVNAKIDAITSRHEAMKAKRFGFLVRPTVLVLGWLVVVFGIITIPLPGPGWLTVFVGIGILSLELHWASRVLAWGVRRYDQFTTWYQSQTRVTRASLVAASCAAVWVAVGGTVFVAWKLGAIPALDPVMHAMM
ncbi:MAG: TIGR02611 family protein [Corynebacterium sp.]|uniref:TIGR02611 family protein n=1 Tax=Corynebacterium sp. TaxID=1720 RepID=UPI0026DD9CCC|nr:TIGR02611 family protein [Corynebacterium sp.]MDO5099811.1 TIGR02611 family protein [Corynebacterium sp.]